MKKYLLVFTILGLSLPIHQSFASNPPSLIELSRAEGSCNPDLYNEVLQLVNFSPLVVSNSLSNVIYKCYKSGNLTQMMHVNSHHGGDINKSDEFTRNPGSVFPHGYAANPLGFLQFIQAKQDLTDSQNQDISQAIQLVNPPIALKPFVLAI